MGTLFYTCWRPGLERTLRLFCFPFFLCCTRLAAQQPTVESLTIADGLSQGMIYDIEQI